LVRYSLRTAALHTASPVEVLSIVNRTMLASEYFGESREPGYCTLVLAYLDMTGDDPELTICRAGHVRPLILHSDGSVESSQAEGHLLGLLPEVSFSPAKTTLSEGTVVVFFTDGLTEAREGAARTGDRRMLEVIAERRTGTAAEILDGILAMIHALDDGVEDDVAVLVVGNTG
jgi:sigma-B regulation protein RsbU (phosphoserine phosphatase)